MGINNRGQQHKSDPSGPILTNGATLTSLGLHPVGRKKCKNGTRYTHHIATNFTDQKILEDDKKLSF